MPTNSPPLIRSYGFGTTVDLPYEQAVQRTREALLEQGFGVLTEIDVRQTLRPSWTLISAHTSFSAHATRPWHTAL